MPRMCARPGCTAPATATFTFDGLRRIMWVSPLADAAAYSAGDLCRRHADRLTPPRNWERRDLRPSHGSDPVTPAGSPAPSRYSAPAPPPPAPAPTLPFERAAARRAPRPLLGPRPEAEAAPTATSPLLSRAFRNAG